MNKQIGAGLQAYSSIIWSSADTLRGAGFKGSDFPRLMMPFFALMLLESRLIRMRNEMISQFESSYGRPFDLDPRGPDVKNDLLPALQGSGMGFHQEIAESGLGLSHVSQVQGGNFLNKFKLWLDQWDPETKRLLGVDYAEGKDKFLDIRGVSSDLHAKDRLWPFAKKWGEIDLVPFDNSEVTTIEEHIKRRWADISADTAGEQYTPSDIIDLAVDICAASIGRNLPEDGILRVYDPTCGGGNFLFAAEDSLREKFPQASLVSFGQELNDALYALSAIEARFRPNARIEYGNTLTEDQFQGDEADIVCANPPYGRDWKEEEKMIRSDASGRFAANRMPPTSDGQLLFLQHIVAHLSKNGVATVVHSGSTLFSGDAGGGESETRKWLLQTRDVVEAIIQLPKNEFFNTGISTYLWVLNAAKPSERKGKVLMIDASSSFTKLQKNLNQKNCEIDPDNRQKIVDAFLAFEASDICKVLEVDDLLYNKVEISITRKDENGNGILAPIALGPVSDCVFKAGGKDFAFDSNGACVSIPSMSMSGVPSGSRAANIPSPKAMEAEIKEAIKEADGAFELHLPNSEWWSQDPETREVFRNGVSQGVGVLSIKPKVSKAKGQKGVEALNIHVSIEPLKEKDTETIPFTSNPKANEKGILDFLAKWVKEPHEVLWLNAKQQESGAPGEAKVGAEINFNRLFPKKTTIRSTEDILGEISALDAEMKALEEKFTASLKGEDK